MHAGSGLLNMLGEDTLTGTRSRRKTPVWLEDVMVPIQPKISIECRVLYAEYCVTRPSLAVANISLRSPQALHPLREFLRLAQISSPPHLL